MQTGVAGSVILVCLIVHADRGNPSVSGTNARSIGGDKWCSVPMDPCPLLLLRLPDLVGFLLEVQLIDSVLPKQHMTSWLLE